MAGRGRGKYTPPTGGRMFLMRSAEECGYDSRNLRSVQDIIRPTLFPDILLHSSGDQNLLRLMEQQKKEQMDQQAQLSGGGSEGASSSTTTTAATGGDNSKNTNEEASRKKQRIGEGSGGTKIVKRSPQALFLISKGREIHHRMQSSVFHVRPTKDIPDVIRHSDLMTPLSSSSSVDKNKTGSSTKLSSSRLQVDASAVLSNCLGGQKRTALGRYVPEELVSGQIVSTSNMTSEDGPGGLKKRLANLAADERLKKVGEDGEDEDQAGGDELAPVDEEEDDGEDYVTNYYESEGDESGGGDDNEATF